MNIDKLLNAYVEKFNDTFPVKFVLMSEEELCATIQECIDTNTPYELDYDKDSDI